MDANAYEKIDRRLSEMERKINLFDKLIWVAVTVLAIFGVSGGFGLKVLNSANETIKSLSVDVDTIEDTIDDLNKVVNNAEDEISAIVSAARGRLERDVSLITRNEIDRFSLQIDSDLEEVFKNAKDSLDQIKRISVNPRVVTQELVINGPTERPRMRLSAEGGLAKLELFNPAGYVVGRVYVDGSENAVLQLISQSGSRVEAGHFSDGLPFISTMENATTHRAVMSLDSNGGKFGIFSNAGEAVSIKVQHGGNGKVDVKGGQ